MSLLCREFGIALRTGFNWCKSYRQIRRNNGKTVCASDFYRLERENAMLKTENEILKSSGLIEAASTDIKFQIVERLKEHYSIGKICSVLGLLKSTYYHRKLRAPKRTQAQLKDDVLRPMIRELFFESKERFGAPKIRALLIERGMIACNKHIVRIMKEENLVCKQERLREYSTTNRKYKYYRNKVMRQFLQPCPNKVWVSDITHVYVNEEFFHICVIIDLYARLVLSWDICQTEDTAFVKKVFEDAFKKRGCPSGLTFHSDQGTPYTSYEFRSFLKGLGVQSSFSRPGIPLDNAVAESFFACMKREELSHNRYTNVDDLRRDVEDFVQYFNEMRPHQRLGMTTPAEIERRYWAKIAADGNAPLSESPTS